MDKYKVSLYFISCGGRFDGVFVFTDEVIEPTISKRIQISGIENE